MEIERKFLISKENLPADLDAYPHHKLEQGYLSTAPVVRIRKEDDNYYLTYKSKGLMTREEYNLPLTKESYEHMRPKADGILISKTRYLIPEKDGLTIELDVFDAPYEGLYLAEVEWNFLLKNRRLAIIHLYGLEKMLQTPVNTTTVI